MSQLRQRGAPSRALFPERMWKRLQGKDRGIDFTGLAVQGEGGHAETPEGTGRVFGLPPPWSPHYNSYMNYDVNGQGRQMPDPCQNSTADRMRRQARVTPNMEAVADARANYRGMSGVPAMRSTARADTVRTMSSCRRRPDTGPSREEAQTSDCRRHKIPSSAETP